MPQGDLFIQEFLISNMSGKYRIIIPSVIIFIALFFAFCKRDDKPPAQLVKQSFDKELVQLQAIVDQKLFPAVQKFDLAKSKTAFLDARNQYKRVEYYIEYFFPTTAVMINGAPVDEIELGENLVENPTGFQVMEGLIYGDEPAKNADELLNEVKKMQLNLKRVARFNAQYTITDAQLFDAIRLEIFRITGLGITGFDTPDALQSIPEAATALSGVSTVLAAYGDSGALTTSRRAADYLNKNPDFNGFDRLAFITDHLDPLGLQIGELRKKLGITTAASGSALNDDAVSLFQNKAFNVNRFVGNSSEFISKEKVTLGEALFNDVILSNSGNRSCASCHNASKVFTDGLTKAAAISGNKSLQRNTPTLAYAGLQRAFFYDLKAGSLEDQALDVVHHKQEMDGSLDQASQRINSTKRYKGLFDKAYNDSTGKVNPWRIQHALASYIRSLAPFNSRFDRYMRGDKTQLNDEEKRGFNLFMGKAKCGSCHFAPVFNGTAPPLFNKSEAEVLGVPSSADTSALNIDADLGRYSLYNYPQYKHAFKTSTVRNITKTAPYMHNGVYKTLDEVLDFYNRGGGAGMGIAVDNQTLSSNKLNLTKPEIKAVIAFLGALEDQ